MLFAFSVVILSAIVNPDLLDDGKKGVTAVFKRAIIALLLMVSIPTMFNMLYAFQKNIMDNSLIEKIILGTSISSQPDTSSSDDSEKQSEHGGNGGQVIAGTLIQALVYPVEDQLKVDEDVNDSYTKMILKNIDYIDAFAPHINATTDGGDAGIWASKEEHFAFEFNGLLAIACGLACVYMLVIYSIDVAVRVFKLAFMELTAPISIVGYIAGGNKILSSWFEIVVKTYVDLFVRIAAIGFYLFLVSNLSSMLVIFKNKDFEFVLKAFLIVGLLIFAKQIPDMISNIFGVDMKSKGGIGGRLGEMAVVGKQAQKAWGAVKKVGEVGAGAGLLGAAAISHPFMTPVLGTALGFGMHAWNKGFRGKGAWKDRTPGRLTKTAGAFFRSTNGIAGTKDAIKTWNENANPTRQYEKEQNKIDKLKKKAEAEAKATANSVKGNLYDAKGDIDKNIAQGVQSKSIMNKSPFKDNQKKTANSYMEKKFDLSNAESDQTHYNNAVAQLQNLMSSVSKGSDKAKVANALADLEAGNALNTKDLYNIKGYSGVVSLIDANAKAITGKSLQSIQESVTDASTAFSTAESAYNAMLDKMGENDKARMKAYVKVGNEVNKANVK